MVLRNPEHLTGSSDTGFTASDGFSKHGVPIPETGLPSIPSSDLNSATSVVKRKLAFPFAARMVGPPHGRFTVYRAGRIGKYQTPECRSESN
jgi:hypothetical protein